MILTHKHSKIVFNVHQGVCQENRAVKRNNIRVTIQQFQVLYKVAKEENPFSVDGKFYATTIKQLIDKTVRHLQKYINCEDRRGTIDIIWQGEGLYHFWFEDGHPHIVNSILAFEKTTGMNHQIYLGNQEEIKTTLKEEFLNANGNFLYTVWMINPSSSLTGKYRDIVLLDSCYSNKPLTDSEVLKKLEFERPDHKIYRVYEIREMKPEDLAEYLCQKELTHLLLVKGLDDNH